MPSFPCSHQPCPNYVSPKGFCEDHKAEGELHRLAQLAKLTERRKKYDGEKRDPEVHRFHCSAAWQRARSIHLRAFPVCERCKSVVAEQVHHKIPVKVATAAQRIDQTLLVSVCARCHTILEAEIRRQERS